MRFLKLAGGGEYISFDTYQIIKPFNIIQYMQQPFLFTNKKKEQK